MGNCEDIASISVEVLNLYDTNYDGSIDSCEVHSCIIDCENTWRDEVCPDYGHIYCDCPFYVPTCDGAWNCDDIYEISVEMLNFYDINYDGDINLEDDIAQSHCEVLVENCDYNNDGTI